MPHTIERQVLRSQSSETIETSSSVNEIISSRPGYFVRKGTTIIFIILFLIVAGMWFIKYPDTLQGASVITTDPLPLKLKSQSGGRVLRIFAKEDDQIGEGQPVAELENNTGYESVEKLQVVADSALFYLQQNDIAQLTRISQNKPGSLGEAQPIYNSLVDAINAYSLLHNQHIYEKRTSNLQSQINNYNSLSAVSAKERGMIDEELSQADERFKANEKLYNSKVISKQEYYEEAEKLRQKKLALEAQRRAGLQNKIAIAGNDKQIMDVRYEKEEKENLQSAAIREQVRNLQNFVQSWRLKYLLCAPYEGRIHYLQPIQINETIAAGADICAIVPSKFRYTAYVNLPVQGVGKVKVGQVAHLMIDQFPNNEFGYLQGTVSNISALPQSAKDGATYRISILLPDSLVTSFHKNIPFSPEMSAQARIITKDRNLLQRLLSGIIGLQN